MEVDTDRDNNLSTYGKHLNNVKKLCYLMFLLKDIHTICINRDNKKLTKRKRKPDLELLFHEKRKRQLWSPLVRSLGSNLFYVHHRVSEELFNKIHMKIRKHIHTNPKFARKTCCRGSISHVDSRSRLSMTLKHLGGSRTVDIMKMHGVSRTTVVHAIRHTFDGILKEYSIPLFPFEDEKELQRLADGFRSKSTGGVIKHIVGVMDGFLLRICKSCIGKNTGINDPSKYFCRKKYYAINCQVTCDSDRKITALSMLSPGAVPDTLAFLKSSLYRDLEMNKLPDRFGFGGDNAYPYPIMTP